MIANKISNHFKENNDVLIRYTKQKVCINEFDIFKMVHMSWKLINIICNFVWFNQIFWTLYNWTRTNITLNLQNMQFWIGFFRIIRLTDHRRMRYFADRCNILSTMYRIMFVCVRIHVSKWFPTDEAREKWVLDVVVFGKNSSTCSLTWYIKVSVI